MKKTFFTAVALIAAPIFLTNSAETAQNPPPASASAVSEQAADLAAQDLAARDNRRALDDTDAALAANPHNARALILKAAAELRLGLDQQALIDSTRATALAPESSIARQTRAEALNRLGRYSDALIEAAATLAAQPQNPLALENRAFALAGLGYREEALSALRQAASVDDALGPLARQAEAQTSAAGVAALLSHPEDTSPPQDLPTSAAASPNARRRFWMLIATTVLTALMILNFYWARRGKGAIDPGAFPAQYEPIKVLSSSVRGEIFEAKDRALGRLVALRRLPGPIRRNREAKQEFLASVRALASLSHPNLVHFYSVAEDGRGLYLVFEYVSGKTLATLLKERGPLSLDAAVRVLKGAAEALDYAHSKQMVHGDLSPKRVMVSESGMVKLVGLGVDSGIEKALTKTSPERLSRAATAYQAPEAGRGPRETSGDVYALAACFYEWLCGRPPFSGSSQELKARKLKGEFPLASSLAAHGLPAGLDDVFLRALSPNSKDRYASAGEFFAAVSNKIR